MVLIYDEDINQNELLIQTIEEVIEGSTTFDRLMNLIEEREKQVVELMESFSDSVNMEDETVRQMCQESIDNVEISLRDYLSLLDELASFSADFNKQAIQTEIEKLDEMYNYLNLAFLMYRNDVWIVRGPTTHGGINMLIYTIVRLLHDEKIEDEFRNSIDMEIQMAENGIQVFSDAESNFFNDNIKAFYHDYLEELKKFDDYFKIGTEEDEEIKQDEAQKMKEDMIKRMLGQIPDTEEDKKEEDKEESDKEAQIIKKKKEMLETMKKKLEELGERYKNYDVDYYYVSFSYEPTDLPLVNILINTGKEMMQGKAEKGMFNYFLDELSRLLDGIKYRFDSIKLGVKPSSELEKEEADRITKTMEKIQQSIEGFYQYLENDDKEIYKKSESDLLEASREFAISIDVLQRLSEDSGKVTCFKCGFKNPSGRMTCAKCRALLPMVERAEPQSQIDIIEGVQEGMPPRHGPQMTAYVKELLEKGQGLLDGAVEQEEFEKVLHQMEMRMKKASKAGSNIPRITDDIIEDLGEEKAEEMHETLEKASQKYNEGLKSFSIGLSLFRLFMNSISLDNYENAKKTIMEGVESLQESQGIIEKEFKERQ